MLVTFSSCEPLQLVNTTVDSEALLATYQVRMKVVIVSREGT